MKLQRRNVDFSKGELDAKKQELETITSETQKDEDKLLAEVENLKRISTSAY
ncbi:Uncharacterised protein [Sphingobacterium daejeonense]|nr:hypothetical protein [Sphingobacterium daejeonense]VTQ08619.1 Uncharacterised protein [Sphingobacterium daejeonense]